MFFRQGLKFVFRDKKSILFLLLAFLSVLLTAASLCTGIALNSALAACKDSYITIGTVEYTGAGYPDDSYIDENVAEIAESFSPEIKNGVISYTKTENALGMLDEMTGYVGKDRSKNNAVFAVKVIRKSEWDDRWFCRVEKVLFYRSDIKELLISVDFSSVGVEPKEGEYYVINCVARNDGSVYAEFDVRDFYNKNDASSACENITDGKTYSLPQDSRFYNFAKYYQFLKCRLHVTVSDEPKALYPFQQGFISLVDGAFYSDSGCVISKRVAQSAKISVGDTVHLNTAARRGTLDFYFDEFDTTVPLTVTGIFDGDEKYSDSVFVPESAGVKTETLSFTIGQFRFENGKGEEYLENLVLPENIRVTLFDQGYGRASAALNDMAMLVSSVCRICLGAGCAFLLLAAFLTVSNQKKTAGIMTRLGVTKPNIFLYYIVCSAAVAVPASILGAVCAQVLCNLAVEIMASSITVGENALDYFIRDTYAAEVSLSEMFAPPEFVYAALISLGALLCLVGLTALFLALSEKKKRVHTVKSAARRKSCSLKGGAGKYALLSLSRGGGRTAVSVTVAAVGMLLLLLMTSSLSGYRQSFDRLQKESTVSAYFTDIYGQKSDGLVIEKEVADAIKRIDGITSVNAGNSMAYQIISVEGKEAYYPDKKDMNSYAYEAYLASLKAGPLLVFTDNMLTSPEFLTAKNISVSYLDGFDESIFSEKENRGLCVIPQKVQEAYNVEPGDIINLRVVLNIGFGTSIIKVPLKVVGVFASDNGDCNIYTPAAAIIRDDKRAVGWLYDYRGVIYEMRTVEENGKMREVCDIVCLKMDATYSFVSFTVSDCTNLESVKQTLYDAGFSEVRHIRTVRSYIVFNDSSYLESFRATKQRLWYMEHLFPVIYALTLILAAVVPFLMTSMRRREMSIMHSLGQKKSSIFASVFIEQLIVCLACLIVFVPVALIKSRDCLVLIIAFALLWLAGTAARATRSNR